MTSDVRDYYQQMAYNYKDAKEKAKMDEVSLQNEAKMQLATGEKGRYRRTEREMERVKAWGEKCAKQEERFQKAAHWTEDHFQLEPGGKAVPHGPEIRGSSGLRLESPPPSASATSPPPSTAAAAGP